MTYAPSSISTSPTVLSIWAAEAAERDFRYGVRINQEVRYLSQQGEEVYTVTLAKTMYFVHHCEVATVALRFDL
jgi:PhoPQ-activated pathogenicity-related protein